MTSGFTTKDLQRALEAKGFLFYRGSNHKRYELYLDGQATGIKTLVSHSLYGIGSELQSQIARQLKMPSQSYLRRFVSCEIDLPTYALMLRDSGKL